MAVSSHPLDISLIRKSLRVKAAPSRSRSLPHHRCLPLRDSRTVLQDRKKLVKVTESKDSYQGMDENPLDDKSWKKVTAAITCTGENIEFIYKAIFLKYSTLLLEEASRP